MTEVLPEEKLKIVVGIDGSEPSKAALRWAARQAVLTGAQLEAVTAWEYPVSYGFAMGVPEDIDFAADAAQQLRDTVAEVLGDEPEVEVTETLMNGHPTYALLHAAEDAGLLVVGCRGHGAFVGMLLGSVSTFVASHARCPVVIVHDHADQTGERRRAAPAG